MAPKLVTVVAREKFPYDGITRFPGQSFQAPAEDAHILTIVGRVTREAPPAAPDGDAPDAPPEAQSDEEEESPRASRRRSRRKDIVPEP